MSFTSFIFSLFLLSCSNSYIEVDAPDEISTLAYSYALLYEESDTEYCLGAQDGLRSIKIDCSGLVVMCYKYAMAETDYKLLVSDMSAGYMYESASTHIDKADLKKGNLIFMGEEDSTNITHIALFEKIEDGSIYFIDSTQKDTDGDGEYDVNGVTYRSYLEDDDHIKAFGRMRVKYYE